MRAGSRIGAAIAGCSSREQAKALADRVLAFSDGRRRRA